MKSAFIFHGTAGHPKENWFSWLKDQLEVRGYEVIAPQFPTPQKQTLENWLAVLKPHQPRLNSESILIGHSLGGAFLLRVLEAISTPVSLAAFVAAPVGVPPILNWEGDQPFIGHPFIWERIRRTASQFLVYHSDNDPYVSLGNGQTLAKNLETELTFLPGCGHFNEKAGFLKFERLLSDIEMSMQRDRKQNGRV